MGHEAASVRAKQNVFIEGLIVRSLASGVPANLVAAAFDKTPDQLAEIAAEWNTEGPAQDYLEQQFSLHVAHGARCMPPPPPLTAEGIAKRDAQRARDELADAARRAGIRAAQDRLKERRSAPGFSYACRNAQIVELRREGLTLREIAARHSISPGRVAEIIGLGRRKQARHLKKRHGRPLDMGGPRGVWIDYDLVDDQA